MPTTTSSRDNWGRLVEAVLKREQIRQLCHQDSITTVDSDFSELNISPRSVYSSPSPQLPLTNDLVVEEDHFGVERFSLRELRVATHNFSNKKILGKCIYGRVYKGRLADGSIVAVKRLTAEESDELEISSIVAHRNVIGLRGFCITKRKRLLVYPYMANRSVSQCLRERYKSQPPLDWAIRQRIALGVARGLAYLHHECLGGIIHGDIKAENILLDEEFEAVLAGFSLAKFMDCNGIKGSTGFGEGKCSLKSDVYGYGVFLLELITAQQSCDLAWLEYDDDDMKDIDHVIYWVMKLCKDKDFAVMVDRDLEGNFIEEEVEKLLRIALICRQTDPEGRPTMPEVTSWMLEDGEGLTKMWEEFSRNVYEDSRFIGSIVELSANEAN